MALSLDQLMSQERERPFEDPTDRGRGEADDPQPGLADISGGRGWIMSAF